MEFAGQLRHADVVLFRHAAQDEDAVRIELAVSPAAERLGRNRPALAKSRHQIDDKRGRHPEMGRRGTPRMPSLDVIHHTLAKIHRIGLRHRKSPPTGSESHSHLRRNPRRFNLTVRCSKYVGGHSDLVGGSISGDANLVKQAMSWRSSIGTQLDPNSCWMLMRSLETLEIRMTRSNANARLVAEYLAGHPKIARVHYLGFLKEGDPHKTVFNRQCSAPGSTFAFDVKGGEKEAFALLDHLQIMKLAVSLGGTETLISHPASMTHSGVARELREEIGLSDALIRISIGIENVEDLISDLAQGLECV